MKDLNGLDAEMFLERLETVFEAIEAISAEDVLRLANEVLDDRAWSHLVYSNA